MKLLHSAAFLSLPSLGCSSKEIIRSQAGLANFADLIGASKANIISCAGVPTDERSNDGFELMTYRSEFENDSVSSVANPTDTNNEDYCDVMFVIKDDIVSRIKFSGKGHISESYTNESIDIDLTRCFYVIRECGTN
jgi:hypothetical protein